MTSLNSYPADELLQQFDELGQSINKFSEAIGATKYAVRQFVRTYRRLELQAYPQSREAAMRCTEVELEMDRLYAENGWAIITDQEIRPKGLTDFQWRETLRGIDPGYYRWRIARTRSAAGAGEVADIAKAKVSDVTRIHPDELSSKQDQLIIGLITYIAEELDTSYRGYQDWREKQMISRPDLPSAVTIKNNYGGSWVSAVVTAGQFIHLPEDTTTED